MRTAALAALLAAPFVLAFRAGGYFIEPRLWAALGAGVLVLFVAVTAPEPLPRRLPGRLGLASLAGLTAWTALSISWSPVPGQALADAERVALYLAAAIAGVALLRPAAGRAVLTPALAAGAFTVCAYALATRWLPGIVDAERSVSAGGRLEQPLTYWNALGAVAAAGVTFAVAVAADASHGARLRAAAAGGAVVPALALYLTLSRGALAALAAGLVVLLVLRRGRAVAATLLAVGAAAVPLAVVATLFPAFESLDGDAAARRWQGLAMLALSVLGAGAAAALQRAAVGRAADAAALQRAAIGREGHERPLRGRRSLAVATVVAVVVLGLAAVRPGGDGPDGELPTSRERLTRVESNRFDYWSVAIDAVPDHPLQGAGAGGFGPLWLRERPEPEAARDAHSLYVETLMELGVVGLLLLGGLFAAFDLATRRVRRRGHDADRTAAAGWVAGAVVLAVHAGLDWDWEMPAVALQLVLLMAAMFAAAEEAPR